MFRFGKGRKVQQRRFILEQLEARNLLSGFSMAGAMHSHTETHEVEHHATAAVHSHAALVAAAAPHVVQQLQTVHKSSGESESGSENDSGETESNETTLTATLSDPNSAATGTATFSTDQEGSQTSSSFRVTVKGAAPKASLDIAIDGTPIGTLQVDANGNGSMLFSSNPKNSKASQLPPGLQVNSGSNVTVGSLTGSLSTSQESGKGDSHEKDD